MKTFQPQEVAVFLSAAGLTPEEWDVEELTGVLEAQWAQTGTIRQLLAQTDEPILKFDPRWV